MDYENNDYFGFDEQSGGYFPFQGVMSNAKQIDTIEITGNTVTIKYNDNNEYSASADVEKNSGIVTIKNLSESWNNNYAKNGIAMESLLAIIFKNAHPISLEYRTNSYTVPTGITPASGETFDSIVETWGQNKTDIYGVGLINRGQANETVTRLIFPDASYITLIGW